ncbi:hypothetical protein I4U23_004684 [Adineta vaga]|nr:hypothetical protein I4U23_004684 [Adineta vaga]
MLTGCYPLKSLIQSTLMCLYDQECIDPINTFETITTLIDLFDGVVIICQLIATLIIEGICREN